MLEDVLGRKQRRAALTASGRQRASSDYEGQDPHYKVLWALQSDGPSTTSEIASTARMDPLHVRSALVVLENNGLIEWRN